MNHNVSKKVNGRENLEAELEGATWVTSRIFNELGVAIVGFDEVGSIRVFFSLMWP